MFWFNFNKKDKKDEFVPKSTKEKVEENILSCKQSKNKLLDRRDDLRKRINSAINSCYFVPSKWWYKEFKHYDKIVKLAKNKLLSSEIKTECDELVIAFKDEMQIIDVQIEHYDFLISSYSKTLDKISNSKDEYKIMLADLEKMKQLEKSKSTLNEIKDKDDQSLAKELIQEEKYKDIKQEIDNLQEDLELFEEYIKQLKKLK